MSFAKSKPIERVSRDMKNFDRQSFRNDLKAELEKIDSNYESFENIFTSVLDRHAQLKKRLVRANEKLYVT